MKSPVRYPGPKRQNAPDALRRRRAKADARREAWSATLPPIPPDPEPLSVWRTVEIRDRSGDLLHRIVLYVPTSGRCDQWAAEIDGERCERMMTATSAGRRVAGMISKRPSLAMLDEARGAA